MRTRRSVFVTVFAISIIFGAFQNCGQFATPDSVSLSSEDASSNSTPNNGASIPPGLSVLDSQMVVNREIRVEFRLDRPDPDPIQVGYATANGTAAAGVNYSAVSGSITIPAGSTSVNVPISILRSEMTNVSFTVTATSVSKGLIGRPVAMVTIPGNSVLPNPNDPCVGNPTIGTPCAGGAIYAGIFRNSKIMVTPSGCTDSANPVCAGGLDTVTKSFVGTGGMAVDIPGISNSPQTNPYGETGDVNTTMIVNNLATAPDSAAHFCANMTYGGYNDWYLPTYAEMSYLMCKAQTSFYNSGYPTHDPGCASVGGKQMLLTGFISDTNCSIDVGRCNYATSSEQNNGSAIVAYPVRIYIGVPNPSLKTTRHPVRCIRRYN